MCRRNTADEGTIVNDGLSDTHISVKYGFTIPVHQGEIQIRASAECCLPYLSNTPTISASSAMYCDFCCGVNSVI
eukprot:scaffold234119_cov43-Cyclotella_meneghiniana.AAC.1